MSWSRHTGNIWRTIGKMRDNSLDSGEMTEPGRLCFSIFYKEFCLKIPEKGSFFFWIAKKYHEKELKLTDFYDKVNKNIYYLNRTSEFLLETFQKRTLNGKQVWILCSAAAVWKEYVFKMPLRISGRWKHTVISEPEYRLVCIFWSYEPWLEKCWDFILQAKWLRIFMRSFIL